MPNIAMAIAWPNAGSSATWARIRLVSNSTASTSVTATAPNCHSCGDSSQDQPTRSPGPSVWMVTGPRPSTRTSMAMCPRRISQQPVAGRCSANSRWRLTYDTSRAPSASSARCSGSRPPNTGDGLSSSMAASTGRVGEARGLLGDVDAHRAPRDAAAAADTARFAELVVPGAELVADPLPVAARGGRSHRSAVQEGEVEVEAGGPALGAFGVLAGQVGGVLDCGAEAGRADRGAVAAGQAALRDIGPVR